MDEKEQAKTTAVKGTESARKVRAMVKNLYRGAGEARAQGKKVAYFMVASQYDEILRAMDVVPVPTENYAGLCAAKRDMDRFLLKAEADGYSQIFSQAVKAKADTGVAAEHLGIAVRLRLKEKAVHVALGGA